MVGEVGSIGGFGEHSKIVRLRDVGARVQRPGETLERERRRGRSGGGVVCLVVLYGTV